MAIKAIINNTEKEIEQIKNSDEQDVDYVYSRIGDTEVEGEPPISIKSIGGELANYRIYGNTVGGESVGDLVESGEHAGEYVVPVTVEGKNLLQNTATSQTINGVTFTVNSDGSVTCNGTASVSTFFSLKQHIQLEEGQSYYLTGCPTGGGASSFRLYAQTDLGVNFYLDSGNGAIINYISQLEVLIVIYSGYTCDNLTFYPMIRKADIEDDTYEPYHTPVTTPIYLPEPIKMVGDEAEYIDYAEQKMHRIGADDVDVTLPALSTIKGTNTLSVNTSIQPSNIYIKDSFDYKKVFTATRTIEDELPLNYRNIEDNDSTLDNYRIYGNTVDGESVGDRTGNLFDEKWLVNNNWYFDKHALKSVNPLGDRRDWSYNEAQFKFELSSGTYTITLIPLISPSNMYSGAILYNNNSVKICGAFNGYNVSTPHTYTFTLAETTSLGLMIKVYDGVFYIMLNEGSTPLPYEPYGYKVPVTVSNDTDTLTTPIYLPEQMRKVGDYIDYIDYGSQKFVHRVVRKVFDGTETFYANATSDYIDFYSQLVSSSSLVSINCACNYFICLGANDGYIARKTPNAMYVTVHYISGRTVMRFYFNDSSGTSKGKTAFKSQLADWYANGDPLIVDYIIVEPVEEQVTLPALPTLPGTNVLSVGTAVQPSEVYIKGKIKEAN